MIVGGCDGGLLEFYSADSLLKKANDPLIGSTSKHNGGQFISCAYLYRLKSDDGL